MSECTHNCSTCGESCAERATPQSLRKAPHPESHIGKVFGVVSGKGGVGKSMVTSQLAVTLHRRGYKVGVMDADITGPSIPQAFGVHDKAVGTQTALYPCVSHSGIEVMSINLLLEDETDPVIWRGPVIGGVVQQFWTDVAWDVDYLFVDMPPGTGDVPLSVFQSIALDGIIVVTSPQELVSMVVEKAVKMAEKMDVPIVGVVENMSYVACPDCGKKIYLFGEGKSEEAAKRHNLPLLAQMPEARRPCGRGQDRRVRGHMAERRRRCARKDAQARRITKNKRKKSHLVRGAIFYVLFVAQSLE